MVKNCKRYTREFLGEVAHTKQTLVDGYSSHKLYPTWRMMNVRCYDDRHVSYHRYGGRGITVCKEWRWDNKHGFYNFLKDVGERPVNTTLDKIDNDSHYQPNNVRWADKKTQQNNIGVSNRSSTGELGIYEHLNALYVQVSLFGKSTIVGVFNLDQMEMAKERNKIIREIRGKQGDQAAYDFYLSLVNRTPSGKVIRRNKESSFYGVARKRNKWRAFTNEVVDGKLKQIGLGVFISEVEAFIAVLDRMKFTGAISEEYYELEKSNSLRY